VNKLERAAMVRLIDHLGAEVLVNLTPPPSRTARERAMARADAALQAEDCKACGLCDHQSISDVRGAQYPSLAAPMYLTVVTAFPEDGGTRYGRMINRAIGRHMSMDHVAWVPVTSCVPRQQGDGVRAGALRPASKIETKACAPNLVKQLDAAGAPLVLIIGGEAMKAWRDDVSIDALGNNIGVWADRYVVGVIDHPATAKRKSEVADWIERCAERVWRLQHETGFGDQCLAKGCLRPMLGYDGDGLPWCDRHYNPKDKKVVADYVNERLPL
jgi:uracil-DNA glycosylase